MVLKEIFESYFMNLKNYGIKKGENCNLKLVEFIVSSTRYARAAHDVGAEFDNEKDKDKKKYYMFLALDIAKKAIEIDDNCSSAHRWCGILIQCCGDFKATKEQIAESYCK